MSEPLKIFISYSHKDSDLKKQLDIHLKNLERTLPINVWSDNEILGGQEWNALIFEKLRSSHIILILLSPDFIASDFCYKKEMTEALELHDHKRALIIPIMLRTIKEEGLPFTRIQTLPTKPRYITDWENKDAAFTDVITGMEQSIKLFIGNIKVRDISFREEELIEFVTNGCLLIACDKLMDFATDFTKEKDYRIKAMSIKGTCKFLMGTGKNDVEEINKIMLMILSLIDEIKLQPTPLN
jgi:hypothetical protein